MLLRLARHIVGMALVALANPLIYYDPQPVTVWFIGWLGALLFSSVFFVLYALFFTERARSAWPRSLFVIGWVLVLLVVINGWSEYIRIRSSPQTQSTEEIGGVNGVMTSPVGSRQKQVSCSAIDAFLDGCKK